MFLKDEYVNHQGCGVCKIIGNETIIINGTPIDYYVCKPIYGRNKNMVLKVPIVGQHSLSKIISKQEALSLIDAIPAFAVSWEDNAKLRGSKYVPVIKEANLYKMTEVLKSIHKRKAENAKLSNADNDFAYNAELHVYGNLATALGISFEDVKKFIADRLKDDLI